MTAVLPLLWALPVQAESGEPQASEPEQRRIVIESSANYQFTDSVSGIEHQGTSQAVRIRRRHLLNSPTHADTALPTASEQVNHHQVPVVETSIE
ncbi:MAG: hypothetical protein AAFP03_04330 [Cyanobacteria bacterium J06598_3]